VNGQTTDTSAPFAVPAAPRFDWRPAFNAAMSQMENLGGTLARLALGQDLPLFLDSLADALRADAFFSSPFQGLSVDTADASLADLRQMLIAAGLKGAEIQQLSFTPDANGDLVRITRTITLPAPVGTFGVAGRTRCSY